MFKTFISFFRKSPNKWVYKEPPKTKEQILFEIVESLFDNALKQFPSLLSIGVVLDEREGGFLANAGFSSDQDCTQLHFISTPLEQDEDIKNKAVQERIEKTFITKIKQVIDAGSI